MTRTRSVYRIAHRHQAGAALVVGLLMLLVLTVLAVSGVNTSSLNLMMAGNTQYSQNAFQAAEAGIERALAANNFVPDVSLPPERQRDVTVSDGAKYTAVSTLQLGGLAQPALAGASQDKFSTYHFEIDSSGQSLVRDAVARNVQGMAVIAPFTPSFQPIPSAPGSGGGGAGTKVLE